MNATHFDFTPLLNVISAAEDSAAELVLLQPPGQPVNHSTLEDRRTEILGEVFEALDQLQPGLGTRLYRALYPFADEDPDERFDPAKAPTLAPLGPGGAALALANAPTLAPFDAAGAPAKAPTLALLPATDDWGLRADAPLIGARSQAPAPSQPAPTLSHLSPPSCPSLALQTTDGPAR